MKSLKIFGFIMFVTIPLSAATKNSLVKTCSEGEGKFLTLQAQKEINLCFFKESGIGAKTLLEFKENGEKTEALTAYQKGSSGAQRGGVCGSFSAELVEVSDSTGQVFNLCKFDDGSYIEETTLWLGSGHNEELDKVLSSRY